MIYPGIRYNQLLYKSDNYRYKLYPFIPPNSSPSDVRQPIEGASPCIYPDREALSAASNSRPGGLGETMTTSMNSMTSSETLC